MESTSINADIYYYTVGFNFNISSFIINFNVSTNSAIAKSPITIIIMNVNIRIITIVITIRNNDQIFKVGVNLNFQTLLSINGNVLLLYGFLGLLNKYMIFSRTDIHVLFYQNLIYLFYPPISPFTTTIFTVMNFDYFAYLNIRIYRECSLYCNYYFLRELFIQFIIGIIIMNFYHYCYLV